MIPLRLPPSSAVLASQFRDRKEHDQKQLHVTSFQATLARSTAPGNAPSSLMFGMYLINNLLSMGAKRAAADLYKGSTQI